MLAEWLISELLTGTPHVGVQQIGHTPFAIYI